MSVAGIQIQERALFQLCHAGYLMPVPANEGIPVHVICWGVHVHAAALRGKGLRHLLREMGNPLVRIDWRRAGGAARHCTV